MTSEPDDTPRRRPPTIDLKATEVEAEQPVSTGEEAGAAGATDERTEDQRASGASAREDLASGAGAPRGGDMAAYAIAALAGALAMLAIVAVLWVSGVLPRGETMTSGGSEPVAAAGNKEFSARLDKIEAALAAQQTALAAQRTDTAQRPDAALASRVAATEGETKSLGDSVAALTRRIDGIATTAGNAAARADAATAAVEAAKNSAQQSGVQRSDLDALANRVAAVEGVTNRMAAIESAVKALSEAVKALSENVASVARRPASADDRAARTTVAAEALRAAVERGVPYQAELAAVKSLGVEESVSAPLEPFAADGVPSVALLARELTALTPALLHVSGVAPSENSFLGRLQANAEKLVRVSPVDAPPGDDPGAIIARIDVDARRSDIAAALAEIARLPEAARALAAPWVKKAEAREAAIAASRRIAADALAALGKPAQQ
jgi:hypothetical protein